MTKKQFYLKRNYNYHLYIHNQSQRISKARIEHLVMHNMRITIFVLSSFTSYGTTLLEEAEIIEIVDKSVETKVVVDDDVALNDAELFWS